MNKRILSMLLVICLVFSTTVTSFAKGTTTTSMQEGQNTIISYIGEHKLVLWESGDIVYAEQYDLQGNLIASGRANRISGEIVMSGDITNTTFNAKDIVKTISSNQLPSLYAFKRVGTFPVYDRITLDRQSMYLYEDLGSAIHTTYSIRSFSGTVAALALGIAAGMAVPAAVASRIVAAIISAGLGVLAGDILNVGTKITLAANKYELEYYGQDSKTGKKSSTYSNTDKYVITDEESSRINEIFYDGSSYYDPNNDDTTSKLMQYIVPNLYGPDYEWDRW